MRMANFIALLAVIALFLIVLATARSKKAVVCTAVLSGMASIVLVINIVDRRTSRKNS